LRREGVFAPGLLDRCEDAHRAVYHPAVSSSPEVRVKIVDVAIKVCAWVKQRRALELPLLDTDLQQVVFGRVCADIWSQR